MLSDNRKISILEKVAEICKSKAHPNFTQANIIAKARLMGQPNNKTTKGTFSKYLNNPTTSFKNVSDIFYEVMSAMLKEENISLSANTENKRLSVEDFAHVLPMFMNVGEHDEKQAKQSLPGEYWAYIPSIAKPDCIVKGLLRIKENRGGTLSAEELFYYTKEGFSGFIRQKSNGYIVKKSGHSLMILNDPSSYLPKIYLMHMFASPNHKCLKLSGRGIMLRPDTDVVKIIQRKILCIRAKGNVPTDKMTLIKECGMGVHTKDTTDDVVKGLFETLMTN